MADQITDNRTSITTAETATNFVDIGGTASGTADNEIFIQGNNSVSYFTGSTLDGLLYNFGAVDVSNNTFYIWINCGIVGLLDTKDNGGFRIRFAGASVNDYFEVHVGGSDSWPTAIEGGWVQFVVDIEEARAAATGGDATKGGVGGTTPATNQVQHVGWAAVTGGTMPRMTDNTWTDEIARLPDNTPGIIIEGRNGGTTDWDSSDIATQLGNGVGTFTVGPGGSYVVRTPIQFGINDTTTHGFSDSNVTWLWDNQEFVPDSFYGLSALGNSGGTTNVTFGAKTGTGDDATGAQGAIIQAASGTAARWFMDFDDPDLDGINLYGCSFLHGSDFQLDDPAVSVISSLYIDCQSATVSNSEQLRVSVINAATADGVAFMTTDDLTDIVFSTFEFSDGHAVELTTPAVTPQTSKGNLFTGYGGTGGSNGTPSSGSTDAAVYNNTASAVTINVTNEGDTPSVRNGASATTTVNNTKTLTVNVSDTAGNPIDAVRVRIQETDGTLVSQGSTNASGVYQDTTYSYSGDTAVEVIARKSSSADNPRYKNAVATGTITTAGLTVSITMIEDTIVT